MAFIAVLSDLGKFIDIPSKNDTKCIKMQKNG